MTSREVFRSTANNPVEPTLLVRIQSSSSATVGCPSVSMRRCGGTRGSRSVHSSRWTTASATCQGLSSRRLVSSTTSLPGASTVTTATISRANGARSALPIVEARYARLPRTIPERRLGPVHVRLYPAGHVDLYARHPVSRARQCRYFTSTSPSSLITNCLRKPWDSAPIRCLFCKGTGEGQAVVSERGMHQSPCRACNGFGRASAPLHLEDLGLKVSRSVRLHKR